MKAKLEMQAQELEGILQRVFARDRYHEHTTLWGVAYHWDGNDMSIERQQDYRDFIPSIFAVAEEQGGTKKQAVYVIPVTYDPVGHFSLACLENRGMLERTMEGILGGQYQPIREIMNDQFLLDEAMQTYAEERNEGKLNEEVDFITFLVRYTKEQRQILKEKKAEGTFTQLAKRLVFRYGEEEFEKQVFQQGNQVLGKEAKRLHDEAMYERNTTIDPELLAEYQKGGNGEEQKNGIKTTPVKKIILPGKRRVREGAVVTVDWEEFLDAKKRQRVLLRNFSKEEFVRETVRQRFINLYAAAYQRDPSATMRELEERFGMSEKKSSDTRSPLEIVHNDVLAIFRSVDAVDQSPTIAHTMYVAQRKK